jgi:hypothetical protein
VEGAKNSPTLWQPGLAHQENDCSSKEERAYGLSRVDGMDNSLRKDLEKHLRHQKCGRYSPCCKSALHIM